MFYMVRLVCRPLSRAPIVHAHLQAARTTGVSGYLMAAILPKASSTSFLTCGL